MLTTASKLINLPILSIQTGSAIARITEPVIDPHTLKIVAFRVDGPLIANSTANLLDAASVREYSSYGLVIDSIDELVSPEDIVKLSQILELNFHLIGLKVETKKGHKLGQVSDFTVSSDNFIAQQIIVKRPLFKSFIDPELTISRKEIVEITDYKIIVKDEEKTIKAKSQKEDFVPNFVNPFRKPEPATPTRTKAKANSTESTAAKS